MSYTLIDRRPPPSWDAPSAAASPVTTTPGEPLADPFGRRITYLRLSITDRCDLRCTYCMPERMQFLPKRDLLSFEELEVLVDAFIARGVRKLRITGGEPLVRKGVLDLMTRLGERLAEGRLDELALTTNGTHLAPHAQHLADVGVQRVNVSLDTLNPDIFHRLTRRPLLKDVLAGIEAAAKAGLKVKINTVALADANRAEIPQLIRWAHDSGFDLSLIEVMPMGAEMTGRPEAFLSLEDVRRDLQDREGWTLSPLPDSTGGPSRYVRVAQTGGRLGFISPLSHNFCATCNRVRLTCTGRLYTCLGHEAGTDLRAALREDPGRARLDTALDAAIGAKPERHDFHVETLAEPASPRTMSVTGG